MERRKVFIGIPCYDERMHIDLAGVIFQWGKKFDLSIGFAVRAVPLHAARNIIVKKFLTTDCEYLFFIDDDVIPPQNALEELIEADKQIIMPATLMLKPIGPGMTCPVPQCMGNYNPAKKGYRPMWGEGIVEVETIGGAAFLCAREVFTAEPYKFRFEYYPDGSRRKGADVAFSEDMRARGHKLYAHFDIACRHVRQCDLLGVYNTIANLNKEKKDGAVNSS